MYWTVGPGSVQNDRWQKWKHNAVSLSPLIYTHNSVKPWQPFLHVGFLVTALCFDNQTLSCPQWLLAVVMTDSCPDVSWQNPVQNGGWSQGVLTVQTTHETPNENCGNFPSCTWWHHFICPYESPLVTFVTLVTLWGSESSKGLLRPERKMRLNISSWH